MTGLLRAVTIAALAATVGLVGCSSSGSSASPTFSKGLVYFYSPAKGTAPALSSSFTNCVAQHLKKPDQTAVAGAKNVSQSLAISDAVSIRVVRASDSCDHKTTATGVQHRILDGGETVFDMTPQQKSCVSDKTTTALPKLDETKIKGSNSPEVSKAIIGSFQGCVPISQFIAGEVKGELTGTTPAQAKCIGDAVAKTTTYDQMVNNPDAVNATVTSAVSTCAPNA